MAKIANQKLQPLGLTLSQSRFLDFLRNRKGEETSQRDFELHFEVSHPTATGIIKRLEEKGLIVTKSDENDRRKKLIELTPAETACYNKVREYRKEIEQVLTRDISDTEMNELRRLLNKLYHNIPD